jgi:quercetin dioxygenase-like cupin family protein
LNYTIHLTNLLEAHLMIYLPRMSLLIVLMAGLFSGYAPPAPTVIARAESPITVEAGEYNLLGASFSFLPGEYVPYHSHGGPDLVTVVEGEVIEHEPGGDRTVKAGESWINQAGERHAVTNSDAKGRIWAIALLPRGDTSITGPAIQIPLNVRAGEYYLVSFVLDFAPGTGLPEQYHGGNAFFYVMDGEITLLEKGATRQLKIYESWTEAPGAVYSVTNASGKNTRVAAGMLLPKGAEETTLVSTPTPPATQEVANSNVNTPASSATQNVSNSSFLSVLIVVGLLLIVLAAGFYFRRAKG